MYAHMLGWHVESEDNLQGSGLSFYHVGLVFELDLQAQWQVFLSGELSCELAHHHHPTLTQYKWFIKQST